jgi:hypothetical protein
MVSSALGILAHEIKQTTIEMSKVKGEEMEVKK